MSGLRISDVNQGPAGGILNTHVFIGTQNGVCLLKYNMRDHMPTKYSMYTQFVFHHNSVSLKIIKLNKSMQCNMQLHNNSVIL